MAGMWGAPLAWQGRLRQQLGAPEVRSTMPLCGPSVTAPETAVPYRFWYVVPGGSVKLIVDVELGFTIARPFANVRVYALCCTVIAPQALPIAAPYSAWYASMPY